MTWLAGKLNKEIQIRQAVQTPNTSGGFDRSYELLLSVWAGIRPIELVTGRPGYIRHVQTETGTTHEFIIRKVAIEELGKSFGDGFGNSFNSIDDINSLKTEFFIFMQKGDNDWEGPFSRDFQKSFDVYFGLEAMKGRLFRIRNVINNDERDEYVKVYAEELEEHGTGFRLT